jgi:5'-methylthioadenosine phosphorylase
MKRRIRLAVIGGSGLYKMAALQGAKRVKLRTPFGDPSDAIVTGELAGVPVGFLPRHGVGHRIPPAEINFRANLWALKSLGAEFVIAISAVGSLREEIRPGDLVVPDQFLDRTRGRKSTFFETGLVAHVGFADPVCAALTGIVLGAARAEVERAGGGRAVHPGGAYLCMEGPQFSTRAESNLGRIGDRHDEPPRSEARARGRDLFRDARDRDRL